MQSNDFCYDEVIPYKKKSKAHPPKKAKHKHAFEPCVFEYPLDWYQKEHLRTGAMKVGIQEYCPICGKLTLPKDMDRWYHHKQGAVFTMVPTSETCRELDPSTRTLPTFYGDDPFAKYVDISAGQMKD